MSPYPRVDVPSTCRGGVVMSPQGFARGPAEFVLRRAAR